ncbi:hypothetical protein ACFWBC_28680 [Streptomyces sp. NPDC059985]|uniref:hypothetical protein n=1 Tax=Streptomyces sp. NPDC059985 TaxID=3347025 RepID=UPI003681865A
MASPHALPRGDRQQPALRHRPHPPRHPPHIAATDLHGPAAPEAARVAAARTAVNVR